MCSLYSTMLRLPIQGDEIPKCGQSLDDQFRTGATSAQSHSCGCCPPYCPPSAYYPWKSLLPCMLRVLSALALLEAYTGLKERRGAQARPRAWDRTPDASGSAAPTWCTSRHRPRRRTPATAPSSLHLTFKPKASKHHIR